MSPQPGEIWLADLGLAAKTRPVVIVVYRSEVDRIGHSTRLAKRGFATASPTSGKARDPARMIEALRIRKDLVLRPKCPMVRKVDRHDFARAGRGDRMIKSATAVRILTTGRASGYNLQEGATV